MIIQRYDVGRCLLLDLLHRKRMTQADLSFKTGIARSQINAYINNKQVMSASVMKTIASALNCRMEELYEWILR
jgi:transcriptional regulator with XRE-family HTH domain